VAVRKVNNRR